MVSERSGAAFYTRDVNTFVLHKLDLLRVLETIASPVVVNLWDFLKRQQNRLSLVF